MSLIRQCAYIKFGRLWASDYKTLKQVDTDGNVIRTINDAVDEYRAITVTVNGDLLYVHNNGHSIQMTTQNVTTLSCAHQNMKKLSVCTVLKSMEISCWVLIIP